MSQELHEALSKLTVKEILNRFKGKLSFSRTQRCSKDALVTHILANAPSEDLELMRGTSSKFTEVPLVFFDGITDGTRCCGGIECGSGRAHLFCDFRTVFV